MAIAVRESTGNCFSLGARYPSGTGKCIWVGRGTGYLSFCAAPSRGQLWVRQLWVRHKMETFYIFPGGLPSGVM